MTLQDILWEIASYMLVGVAYLLLIFVIMVLNSAIFLLGREMKRYIQKLLNE